ncbi:response regulator transcription factor [Streptosporangium roseum]|uniref:Response regulator receiver protein n=1 Tax=Streptosporangium roseum (strain ATCC 12428 / DSM 43021 / JCM 3005 / KCTC 9067 / NCIMB 10171 / NRRL 2505 / NI 9100) TaxID=479432 RepID=D2B2V0_STRRD|nr:response regulator transcription factor [Streptosporangium roseum]ACZ83577.1 response regulator receiver protein [Streptosporangium roseum DSM 43021]
MITVLIVDDHPVFRQGLRGLLSAMEIEVVGEASGGQEAVALAAELQPDVVVMDLQMPGGNGVEATRTIVRTSPRIGVLVLTMFRDDDSVFTAMRAGARGYLLKEAGAEEIGRAVHAVAAGEAIYGPEIARRVLTYFAGMPDPSRTAFPELTEREREVLELVAQGRGNNEIAGILFLSGKTVRNHVSNIFMKLQVADRAQAIVRAREAGLGGSG